MLHDVSHPADKATAPGRAWGRPSSHGAWMSREEAIMGTSVRVELWASSRHVGAAAIDAVMAEMHRIDCAMSPHKADSELSRINREAAHRAVPLSGEMARLIERALEFSALSGGAFDITYAGVGRLYDYRAGIKPSDEALAAARATVGWRHLILDREQRSLRFAREGVCIDLGGFAKGHAVDRSVAILRRHGIANATVAAGGDSHVMGDRGGRPWSIGIRDPRREGGLVAVLPLEDVSISTSGDYERYFEQDGVRHHHVLDPKTGRSPSALRSVTILAGDGLTTEALSKCLFVMGLEVGMRLVESQPGVDAVVVDASGVLHYSSGLLDGAAPPSP